MFPKQDLEAFAALTRRVVLDAASLKAPGLSQGEAYALATDAGNQLATGLSGLFPDVEALLEWARTSVWAAKTPGGSCVTGMDGSAGIWPEANTQLCEQYGATPDAALEALEEHLFALFLVTRSLRRGSCREGHFFVEDAKSKLCARCGTRDKKAG